jgi:hypothetical protein
LGGATAYGIEVDNSFGLLEVYGVHVVARSATSYNYGVYTYHGSVCAYDSQFVSDTDAIYTSISASSYLGVTMLDGDVSGSGNYQCFNVYDDSMGSIVCPP